MARAIVIDMPPGATSAPDAPARLLDSEAVHGYARRRCFRTGPPGLVGTELEWLVVHRDDPTLAVPLAHLRTVVEAGGPPPQGSRVTFEPGGQVELSSPAHRGASACWRALSADAHHLLGTVQAAGLALLPTAIDPYRSPVRQLVHPRYEAMEAHFAAVGGDTAHVGPVMMNATAATQVNLDIGRDPADAVRRWRLLHAVGPTMVATFANSPVHAGSPTGWLSGRQQVWQTLDPRRTRPVTGEDPAAAWAEYALDAPVMLAARGREWTAPPGLSFRDWLSGDGGPVGRADEDDLATHLTTLFPPVRPRGWFEVRYLDALPMTWWPVAVAVLSSLVEDPDASATAIEACAGVDDWAGAARLGPRAPGAAEAARACFDAALAAMARAGESPELVTLVTEYRDRYVRSGRCPADDPLEV